MASIWERKNRMDRHPLQDGITLATSAEAQTLKRLLDANNQSFEIAQHAMDKNQTKSPTVAAVIQEHIDLLVRPSVGTVHTYQTLLERPGPMIGPGRSSSTSRRSPETPMEIARASRGPGRVTAEVLNAYRACTRKLPLAHEQ